MADEPLNIDITATDKASKVVDPLQDKVDKLEKSDPTVEVAADTKSAKSDVDTFADKLKKLGDADQVVVLALRAGAAQTELKDLATQLATIDASDPDVEVKLDRYNELTGQLDDIESKMKTIADTSLDPDVAGTAQARLQGIGEEAGKAQDAVHSMAGNAVGDFAATATGIGPLGEAIGQLTEQITAGESSMKELATAGLGLGALSGGMLVLNKVMGEFAKTAQKAAEIKAFNTADVDAFTKALTAGKDVADDYVDRMTQLGKVTTVASAAAGLLAGSFDNTTDIAPQLAAAGITMAQFAAAVTGSADDLRRFDDAVKQTGLSADDQNLIISGAATEYDNLAKAAENAAQFNKVFGANAQGAAADTARLTAEAERYTAQAAAAADQTNRLAAEAGRYQGQADQANDTSRTFTDQLKKLKLAGAGVEQQFEAMSDSISADQVYINLANQIDGVAQAGRDAITAQQDADDARRANAKDATEKQREAEQAMRDYQTAVNDAKQEIIQLGQTAGATPVQVSAALKKIDQGDLEGAKQDAENWSKNNPIQLTFGLAKLGAALQAAARQIAGTPVGTSATAPTTVNNFLAAATTGRQLRTVQARHARINGR